MFLREAFSEILPKFLIVELWKTETCVLGYNLATMLIRRLPHQFRFQLIAQWLAATYSPKKAADVGGGKGLLAYLLNQKGWQTTVIDPIDQSLPKKYRDVELDKRILIPTTAWVPRITKPFEEEMTKDFDLLIGLHAHGSNIKIINACAKYQKDFALFPCCVVDEPIEIKPNINWMNSLEEYGQNFGLHVEKIQLNFVRQNKGLFTRRFGH